MNNIPERCWLEINLTTLKNNAKVLQNAMPNNCKLMAVVKANAYGHNAVKVASTLNEIGVYHFAVATIDEAIDLLEHDIYGDILILGYTPPNRAKDVFAYNLTQTIIGFNHALELNLQGYKIKAQIKIDLGMHRLGFSLDETPQINDVCKQCDNLNITGIYTHLPCSDSLEPSDIDLTNAQILQFDNLVKSLETDHIIFESKHTQSSYGLLNYPCFNYNYVRAGIALYGAVDSAHGLVPVLSLKTNVARTRNIKNGDNIGYGRAFVAKKDTRIAILPIGYADGLPRNIQEGNVLINGEFAPIIGNVCMDMLTVDITDINGVSVGDTVTVIGTDGKNEILATQIAEQCGTIVNEIVCRIGSRVMTVFTE